ncbi:MAG TPA: hypothetical protein H9895_01790 [Candidatus Pseudogracilibacillus intestinigallinarum]|uniref:3D domain-containing protein n=1 Tax=Candidatus Pseudogracilibacillus intestinigallinarum TaxID=2838742 RepID=A0A9D1TIU5_9BACI|nr:hypothetical protein [Candidatus Pseudogracilibacillus intestinigallinarum]
MKKLTIYLLAVVLLVSGLFTIPLEANASKKELNDVQDERKEVKEELSKKESELVEVLDDIAALHKEVAGIEQKIAASEAEIAEKNDKIIEYEAEFVQLAEKVEKINKRIDKRQEILKDRIIAYQENGGDISYLEVLFNAKDFNEFISRVNSVSTITNADKQLIEEHEADRQEVEDIQEEITDKIDKQEALVDELEEQKAEVVAQKDELKSSEKSLKDKETTLEKEKQKLGSEDSKLASIEQQYRDEIEAEKAKAAKEQKAEETKVATAAKKEKAPASSDTPKQAATSETPKKPSSNQGKKEPEPSTGKSFTVEATAYGPDCSGCSGVSATGMDLKQKPTPKVIAVDPSVIPLGSKVWVEGYGTAIAADTGGAIKGKKIDVLYPSEKSAYSWGRRTVRVKILN